MERRGGEKVQLSWQADRQTVVKQGIDSVVVIDCSASIVPTSTVPTAIFFFFLTWSQTYVRMIQHYWLAWFRFSPFRVLATESRSDNWQSLQLACCGRGGGDGDNQASCNSALSRSANNCNHGCTENGFTNRSAENCAFSLTDESEFSTTYLQQLHSD